MEREKVYKLIDTERRYQERYCGDKDHDLNHSLSDWILFIERHTEKAKKALYKGSNGTALAEIRKISALCVACMECKETQPRKLDIPKN